MEKRTIEIDGARYTLKIHVEKRRNLRASLRGENINVRVPAGLSGRNREKFISEALEDFRERIRRNPRLIPEPKKFPKYRDGDLLTVGIDEYILRIETADVKRCASRLAGNTIHIRLPGGLDEEEEHAQISAQISRCAARKRLPEIEALVHRINDEHFGRKINKVSLKNTRTRWGSCSRRGNINLSTRLLFAPEDVLEYVCVHELAHLVVMNHSDKFWRLVASVAPDYPEKIEWLKQHADECVF